MLSDRWCAFYLWQVAIWTKDSKSRCWFEWFEVEPPSQPLIRECTATYCREQQRKGCHLPVLIFTDNEWVKKLYWKQLEDRCFHDDFVWSVNSQFSLVSVHVCVVEATKEDIKTSVQTLWHHQNHCSLLMGPSRPVFPANGPPGTGKRVYWLMPGYLAFTSWPRQYNPEQGHDYSWLSLFR